MRRDRHGASAKGKMPRRGTDRFEDAAAWVLMSLGLVLLMVAAMVGVGTRAGTIERSATVRATHTEVTATVLADVPVLATRGATMTGLGAPARWVGPDGVAHEAMVWVPSGTPAGTEVRAWLDRDGRVGQGPTSEAEALLIGVLASFFTVLVGGILLGGVWETVRMLTDVRNARGWEQEWARIGPDWTRGPR
jgi:hypothetical protein